MTDAQCCRGSVVSAPGCRAGSLCADTKFAGNRSTGLAVAAVSAGVAVRRLVLGVMRLHGSMRACMLGFEGQACPRVCYLHA